MPGGQTLHNSHNLHSFYTDSFSPPLKLGSIFALQENKIIKSGIASAI